MFDPSLIDALRFTFGNPFPAQPPMPIPQPEQPRYVALFLAANLETLIDVLDNINTLAGTPAADAVVAQCRETLQVVKNLRAGLPPY